MFGSRSKRISQHGRPAKAVVLEVGRRGVAITTGSGQLVTDTTVRVKVRLRVEPEGGMPYEVTTKLRFQQTAIPYEGQTLGVLVDPEDPKEIILDESMRGMLAGAGLRPDQVASIEATKELAQAGASPEAISARINEIRAAAGQAPAQTMGAAPPAPDPVQQLERLADLRDRGVLSEDEFAAQKARILSGT